MEELNTKETLSIKDYLSSRLNNQITWYSNKSTWNKHWYYRLKSISVSSTAITPIILVLTDDHSWIAMIPAAVTLLTESALSFYDFKTLWITYRQTSELLIKEKTMFQTDTGVYREAEDAFADLVERCETIISKENINWTNLTKNDRKTKKEEGK